MWPGAVVEGGGGAMSRGLQNEETERDVTAHGAWWGGAKKGGRGSICYMVRRSSLALPWSARAGRGGRVSAALASAAATATGSERRRRAPDWLVG